MVSLYFPPPSPPFTEGEKGEGGGGGRRRKGERAEFLGAYLPTYLPTHLNLFVIRFVQSGKNIRTLCSNQFLCFKLKFEINLVRKIKRLA